MEKANIRKVAWFEVRDKVKKVNPRLSDIIDEIDPSQKFPLYIARYPYGSMIVNEGEFYIPSTLGSIVPISDKQIDPKTREELTYSGMGLPAGVVIEHTAHESVTTSQQILPLGVVGQGSIFALWKKLDEELSFHPINMFTITAGDRFIFMVPKISNILWHKNLKRDFNISLPPPVSLLDQWEIFKAIVHHPDTNCNWATELLFFSKIWFEKIKNDKNWRALKLPIR